MLTVIAQASGAQYGGISRRTQFRPFIFSKLLTGIELARANAWHDVVADTGVIYRAQTGVPFMDVAVTCGI